MRRQNSEYAGPTSRSFYRAVVQGSLARRESTTRTFVVIGIILLTIIFSSILLLYSSVNKTSGHSYPARTPLPLDNPIIHENSQSGTTDWKIPDGKEASTQIQAYASMRSVAPGQSLTFYVSTQKAGTHYTLDIFRIGWYQGTGGRLLMSVNNLIGQAQGYFDTATTKLVKCTSCFVDRKTGLVEARWHSSYTLTVPPTWVTGIYLAKLVDAQDMQTYVTFEVLGNISAPYVVVTPDTAYAAYNNWGGYSLYAYNSIVQGVKVSFDRPSAYLDGSDQVLVFEADAIHWMERNGYNLSYMSNIDLHMHPASLLQHKAYISLGHDEYWTKEMRDAVENARDSGVGLAFLEANASYWQVRLEPDTSGVANRTVVCYKVLTSQHDLPRDPFYRKDNTRVTSQWRDPVLNRPENALIGIMYSDYNSNLRGVAWQMNTSANSSLLQGTGLKPGQQYGCGLVGYEWDKVFQNGATPRGLQIIATMITVSIEGHKDTSNTTAYIAPSGAMVFATGAVYWTSALDGYRFTPDPRCQNQPAVVPEMQHLMTNVMAALIVHH